MLTTEASPGSQAGLTLMELMVSISIFLLISMLSFMSLNRIQSANTSIEKELGRLAELQRAVQKMREDFLYITDRPIRNANGEYTPSLVASKSENTYIEFTRSAIDPLVNINASNQQRVAYQLENNTVYRLVWEQLDQARDSKPVRYPVIKNIKQFSVKLFDDTRGVHEQWPATGSTPGITQTSQPVAMEVILETSDSGTIRRLFHMRDSRL